MAQPASVGAGIDPRLSNSDNEINEKDKGSIEPYHNGPGPIKPQHRKYHDSDVTFEEYNFYAERTRAEEDNIAADAPAKKTFLSLLFPKKDATGEQIEAERRGSEVAKNVNLSNQDARATISDEEWTNASRALRTATTAAIFYLITTDIFGPFGLPYAFASMGWGPGVALFTVFGVLAGYSGYLLWQVYMGMDSHEFPIRSFGDMGFRLYGQPIRYMFNILQAIQLILNVGLIVISNGQALSQAVKFKLCFAICCLLWAIAGFFLGQIRTLQKFGWLANAAVWINVLCMIVSMAGAATTGPNYAGAGSSAGAGYDDGFYVTAVNGVFPPVRTTGGVPTTQFGASVNGAMAAVFSFGGSMIFPEFMAEMRRPRDFLKGMWAAQLFIYFFYMFYGLFMYGYQGQYVTNPAYLGVAGYNIQTAGNAFAMASGLIAAALYGNIGVKVIYQNIFVEMFKAPQLNTRGGRIAWTILIPIYWSIAFIIAAGIPDFPGLTGVVAALCILQFTYTFPPMLSVAYHVMANSRLEGERFDPATGETLRKDNGFKRFMRGFTGGVWWLKYMNAFNVAYMLGALCLAALGAYGAIENLITAFDSGAVNSFVCHSPLDG